MTTRHPPVFVALSCTALALLACDSERQTPPKVQLSSLATPTAIVRVQSGQPFTASCLIVSVGETVEWRNLSPRTAISVVSTREPYELSAPALSMPYNFVPPESSDECTVRTNGVCDEPIPFVYWRHTFTVPGVFDYKDASGSTVAVSNNSDGDVYGMPGGATATTVTTAGGTGTVCVPGAGNDCTQVCCTNNQINQCAVGVSCIAGRCGGVK